MKPQWPALGQSLELDGTCRLLISVRDRQEAKLALRAGVDLIDIKEPRAGSLGAASPSTIREVFSCAGDRVPLSVALGELMDPRPLVGLPAGTSCYVKLGLAGCSKDRDWHLHWRERIEQLPSGVRPVAVVYADWRAAGAPPPGEVLEHVQPLGCRAVLVDTFGKSRGNLLMHWSLEQIADFVTRVHRLSLPAVVAGSLQASLTREVVCLGADCIAFRGAACRGGRSGPLDQDLLVQLVQSVRRARTNFGKRGEAEKKSSLKA